MADISPDLQQELDQLQAAYKAAVENWVAGASTKMRCGGNSTASDLLTPAAPGL
jgi:hypothetical protein